MNNQNFIRALQVVGQALGGFVVEARRALDAYHREVKAGRTVIMIEADQFANSSPSARERAAREKVEAMLAQDSTLK